MSSVMVTWKGRCADVAAQARLLEEIEPLAAAHASRRASPPLLPRVSALLAADRGDALPVEPDLRHWDETVEGNVLICGDLLEDRAALADAAAAARPAPAVVRSPRHFWPHVRVSRLHLRGIDFRFYDPRDLYPGEDRFSLVFLRCEEFPFLDGLIAAARGPEWCARIVAPGLSGADWYVECPSLHLRGHLEAWTVSLLSWIRYFHVPDLTFDCRGRLEGYSYRADSHADLERSDGADFARAHGLTYLRKSFADRADAFDAELGRLASGDAAGG